MLNRFAPVNLPRAKFKKGDAYQEIKGAGNKGHPCPKQGKPNKTMQNGVCSSEKLRGLFLILVREKLLELTKSHI